jgi:hypothetical protein
MLPYGQLMLVLTFFQSVLKHHLLPYISTIVLDVTAVPASPDAFLLKLVYLKPPSPRPILMKFAEVHR